MTNKVARIDTPYQKCARTDIGERKYFTSANEKPIYYVPYVRNGKYCPYNIVQNFPIFLVFSEKIKFPASSNLCGHPINAVIFKNKL